MKSSKLVCHIETKQPALKTSLWCFSKEKKMWTQRTEQLLKATISSNVSALRASFLVANHIAKAKKPFIIGEELILPATKDICCELLGEEWHPTPVLLPGKSHGWRNLVGCSPWGCWESDTTERLHFYFSLSCIGEGNGNPLQCSCLENPRDRGAWWAAISGVAQSQTRLKRLSSSSSPKVEKAMASHSSTLAWKIPRTEEPGRLQSMGSDTTEGLHFHFSLFTFMHWRSKWQPTPVFLPGESQRWGSLVGCHLWGLTESDTTEVT